MSHGSILASPTHVEEAPEPATVFDRCNSNTPHLDELLPVEVAPVNPSRGRIRRHSESHVGQQLVSDENSSAGSPRRHSDPVARLRMCRISELLPTEPRSAEEINSERQECIRQMKLLSLEAGLSVKTVHNFSETMVGNSVGDSKRSSRVSSRQPSVARDSAEKEPEEEDPLEALIRRMGAIPLNEPPKKETSSRRPSKVILSHGAMSQLSEIKRPVTSQSTATCVPMASDRATPSPPFSPSPVPALLSLRKRREEGDVIQRRQKQLPIPGDLSWRKCKRSVVDGSSAKIGTVGQADAGAKAILLSNIGLEIFDPSKLPA